ncbi:MAG: hypothetical protein ABW360_14650 [Phenylobacterium sp.]
MTRTILIALAGLAMATSAVAAEPTLAQKLKTSEAARVLAETRLASEIERSDAQVYLMRLELSVTKRQLAAALAKCGQPCAPDKK